jgi:steroid delta-isomerase-like uncharacterized protein
MTRLTLVLAFAVLILPAMLTFAPPTSAQEGTPTDCPVTTPEENAALVVRYWSDVWTAGGDAAVPELLAPDEVHHWGIGGDTTGVAPFTERLRLFLAAFPDIAFTVDQIVSQDDLVASRWTATGTHRAEWQGIAPTEREVTWSGINIFRFACGKIAESWGEADHISLRQQLGASDVPPAPQAASTPAPAAPAATPCPTDTPAANTTVARRWTEEVVNEGQIDLLDDLLAPDAVHHGGSFPSVQGPEAIKAAMRRVIETFPMQLSVDLTIAQGELVAVRWSGTGTHEGPFLGVEPTGAEVTLTGINLYRLSCGRIVESWSVVNVLDQLRQIQAARATPAAG